MSATAGKLLVAALLLAGCTWQPVERPRVVLFVPVISGAQPDIEAPQSMSPLFEAPQGVSPLTVTP